MRRTGAAMQSSLCLQGQRVFSDRMYHRFSAQQENAELADLQAKAAMAAKARAQVDQRDRETARWMKRLTFTPEESQKRERMLATSSIDTDLFFSKELKTIEIEVQSPQEAERMMEVVAQRKAAGEIPADLEFRAVSSTDAVRLHSDCLRC